VNEHNIVNVEEHKNAVLYYTIKLMQNLFKFLT